MRNSSVKKVKVLTSVIEKKNTILNFNLCKKKKHNHRLEKDIEIILKTGFIYKKNLKNCYIS